MNIWGSICEWICDWNCSSILQDSSPTILSTQICNTAPYTSRLICHHSKQGVDRSKLFSHSCFLLLYRSVGLHETLWEVHFWSRPKYFYQRVDSWVWRESLILMEHWHKAAALSASWSQVYHQSFWAFLSCKSLFLWSFLT